MHQERRLQTRAVLRRARGVLVCRQDGPGGPGHASERSEALVLATRLGLCGASRGVEWGMVESGVSPTRSVRALMQPSSYEKCPDICCNLSVNMTEQGIYSRIYCLEMMFE